MMPTAALVLPAAATRAGLVSADLHHFRLVIGNASATLSRPYDCSCRASRACRSSPPPRWSLRPSVFSDATLSDHGTPQPRGRGVPNRAVSQTARLAGMAAHPVAGSRPSSASSQSRRPHTHRSRRSPRTPAPPRSSATTCPRRRRAVPRWCLCAPASLRRRRARLPRCCRSRFA